MHQSIQITSASANTPVPRRQVRFLMEALAMAVGGPVDRNGGGLDPSLSTWLLLHEARLLIGGTACARPLLMPEAAAARRLTGFDTIIVRPHPEHHASFDVLPFSSSVWSCDTRLWMERPASGAWLMPADGLAEVFRLAPAGLTQAADPPVGDELSERRGYAYGRLLLDVATQGWF